MILVGALSFGFGEELGWRGFLLRNLQVQLKPLPSTVILWAVWAGWHLPLLILDSNLVFPGILGFLLALLAGAVIQTWLFNWTESSVLATSLLHRTINLIMIPVSRIHSPLIAWMNAWLVFLAIWFTFQLDRTRPA